ncbi:hypothetical protein TYRP_004802 [Tyrophagus putrescentiae]|nr:hypothetical protein TYRP_004802 [Tyrophagus putrescentiae]
MVKDAMPTSRVPFKLWPPIGGGAEWRKECIHHHCATIGRLVFFRLSAAQPSVDLILDPLQPFPLTPRSHVKVPGGGGGGVVVW